MFGRCGILPPPAAQKGAARECRHGFMKRAGCHIRPERNWMHIFRQETKVRTVGGINKQWHTMAMADTGNTADIAHHAVIIRACQVHRPRVPMQTERFLHAFGGNSPEKALA